MFQAKKQIFLSLTGNLAGYHSYITSYHSYLAGDSALNNKTITILIVALLVVIVLGIVVVIIVKKQKVSPINVIISGNSEWAVSNSILLNIYK